MEKMSSKGVQYQIRRGDMLDSVCHKHYGPRPNAVEAVLDANPGLAKHGPVLSRRGQKPDQLMGLSHETTCV
jgi:phage tail protein X